MQEYLQRLQHIRSAWMHVDEEILHARVQPQLDKANQLHDIAIVISRFVTVALPMIIHSSSGSFSNATATYKANIGCMQSVMLYWKARRSRMAWNGNDFAGWSLRRICSDRRTYVMLSGSVTVYLKPPHLQCFTYDHGQSAPVDSRRWFSFCFCSSYKFRWKEWVTYRFNLYSIKQQSNVKKGLLPAFAWAQ